MAAMIVPTGGAEVVVAGGVESMSNIEFHTNAMRWGARAGSTVLHDRLERGRYRARTEGRFGVISGMIEIADNLAAEYGMAREEVDGLPCVATSVRPRLGGMGPSMPKSFRWLFHRKGVRPPCSTAMKAYAWTPTSRAWRG